jgi:hypothetical protein
MMINRTNMLLLAAAAATAVLSSPCTNNAEDRELVHKVSDQRERTIANRAVARNWLAALPPEPRETQSLDGTWEILFDPENVGRANNWHHESVFSARDDRRETGFSVPA